MSAQKDVVIVTGSSGLIGSAVTKRFVEHFDTVGFDQQGPGDSSSVSEYIYVDVTSDESVEHGLRDVRERHGASLSSVIHLAAFYDFSGELSPKYEEITVRGTERLLKGLKSFQVEQFVFSSTMLVYLGEPETLSYDELQREFGRLIHGEEWTTRQIPKAVAKTGAWLEDELPGVSEPFIKPWMIDLADDHYALDISRAMRLLNWVPHRSLRGTLPRMVEALKADPLLTRRQRQALLEVYAAFTAQTYAARPRRRRRASDGFGGRKPGPGSAVD
jgi:nucleoside-diphosphate-sugar epimerase